MTSRQAEAMRRAIAAANAHGVPWVLDPVGVQFLSYRAELAREFIAQKPSLIRCNEAEASAVGETGCVTLVTGEVDRIGDREIRGGITLQNAAEVLSAGAKGLAVVSAFSKSEDPYDVAKRFRMLFDHCGK